MSVSEQTGRRGVFRVLLVEDENLVAILLEDMLAELGHSVVGPVARLNKALEMAQREAIDLAILYVNINGEQVYPVAEALAARGIPFVFPPVMASEACLRSIAVIPPCRSRSNRMIWKNCS